MAFIDELLTDGYYDQVPIVDRNQLVFGNIYWTHAYYPHENLEIWRSETFLNEATKTIASNFNIVPAGADAFRRSIPLSSPKLETNEELLVVRAKVRPVVLLVPPNDDAEYAASKKGIKVDRKRSLVAQVFSLKHRITGESKAPEGFVDRVRSLMYPQFMFLPQKAGLLEVDSLMRLDECQSVFTPHLDHTNYKLSADVQKLLRSQMLTLFKDADDGFFESMRDLLNE